MKEEFKDLNILYVEDDLIVKERLTKTLEKIANRVFVSDNGQDGLEIFKENRDIIDLVITDIGVPILDGLEMAEQIKKIANPQIIVITAFSDKDTFMQAINSGVDKYILKPIDIKQLFLKIKESNEIIKLKKRIKNQNQMLLTQSRQAAMGEMISMIAHQWRQPISNIAMIVSNILVEMDLDICDQNKIAKNLKKVNEQIQYLSSTISDFKDFFKPNRPKEDVVIDDILRDTLKIVENSIKYRNIEIGKNFNTHISFKTYKNKLIQVLLVLLKNAQDVLIDNMIKNPKITISTFEDNSKIIIIVDDNGTGVEDENISKIFEPYFSTKDEKNGTGLGLYMSKIIVEKHLSGEIFVENTEFGAKFIIEIPL